MMFEEIVLATGNPGKIRELSTLLAPALCIPQAQLNIPEPEENGLSFVENALIKARHASRLANKAALADDSGLVVPVLAGAPGIYSARYAGAQATDAMNINLLIKNMEPFAGEARRAFFYCALVLIEHAEDPMPIIATGYLPGLIALRQEGNEGFGYDPIFYCPDYDCTLAQLPATIKNKISHRAQALRHLHTLITS